jgi:hypothetical protein
MEGIRDSAWDTDVGRICSFVFFSGFSAGKICNGNEEILTTGNNNGLLYVFP